MSAMPTEPMTTPYDDLSEADFAAIGQRLDELVQQFEVTPFPQVREDVFELLQTVDALHRAGLGRLLALLRANDGATLVARAAEDPIVRMLLTLYDFLPSDHLAQVETALTAIRPYIQSHGGEIEVLDVVDGVVHLRMAGACDGCAGSATTLEHGVEAALREGFPGFAGIIVHQPAPRAAPAPANFIPLTQIGRNPASIPQPPRNSPIFTNVANVVDIPQGTMKEIEAEGTRVVLANVAGEVYAVSAACPGSMAPLGLGAFTPPVLVCPWHNEAFDVRTGKRVDGLPAPVLETFPISVRDGIIALSVHAASPAPAGSTTP